MNLKFPNLSVLFWGTLALLFSLATWCISKNLQSAILMGTAVLIAWYSWETFRLRQEMSRQNDLQEMPILNLYLSGFYFQLKNVSKISAFNVYIEPIKFLENEIIFNMKKENSIIEPDGEFSHIETRINLGPTKTRFNDLKPLLEYLRSESLDKDGNIIKEAFVDLFIQYKNMRGQKFVGHYRIGMSSPYLGNLEISLVNFRS